MQGSAIRSSTPPYWSQPTRRRHRCGYFELYRLGNSTTFQKKTGIGNCNITQHLNYTHAACRKPRNQLTLLSSRGRNNCTGANELPQKPGKENSDSSPIQTIGNWFITWTKPIVTKVPSSQR